MVTKEVQREYKQRVEQVINYILKNLNNDLSLETLAKIANYSPFHFQKLFKQITGETPKQYIIKMRLETAAHYLIIHHNRSITEISIDSGFSSPSVFARAFKNYFHISAEQMRSAPQAERIIIRKEANHIKKMVQFNKKSAKYLDEEKLKIGVKRISSISGICVNTTFEDIPIQQSLKEVIKLAKAYDLFSNNSKVIGIMQPHHNIYRAVVSIDASTAIPKGLNKAEIKGGKYAAFKINKSLQSAIQVLNFFYDRWLPENGYKIADIYGFEVFSESPDSKSYQEIEREIYVPIEPA